MQRVDGAYLYDFGQTMLSLANFEEKNCTRFDFHFVMSAAQTAITGIVYQSLFKDTWRVVHASAEKLLNEMSNHAITFEDTDTFQITVYAYQISNIKIMLRELEAIMKAELQALALYYASPKGGFDNKTLIDNGAQLFPASIHSKAPEAAADAIIGARCMAFELWTAMAFHLHRSNEAILRRYYKSVIGGANQPKYLTIGSMVSSMEQHGVGDINIRAALNNIRVFHRNPIAHPDQHLETGDEALSLYAAIRAAMGYMLDKLPISEAIAVTAPPPPLQLTP